MVDIPFPVSNSPGSTPGEGAGRLINAYAYKDGDGVRWRPVPGLDNFAALSVGEVRGGLFSQGSLLEVAGSTVVRVGRDGNVVPLQENVAGTGPVTMARNNNTSPQVVIVTNSRPYIVDGNVIKPYPDINLPLVNSISFLDGFFLFTTSLGGIVASQLNSTVINPISKATAEARPDGLLRGVVFGQQFFAFGTNTIEVWQNAGTTPFPLTRSSVIPLGLIGQWAVAGFEDGWGGPLIFGAQDGSIRRLNGYTPERISTEDLERLIVKVPDKSRLRASVYTFGGNGIWSLSCDDWTWEFNTTTGNWHERESYLSSRWRGAQTIFAFDRWVVADNAGGRLYQVNFDTRAEGGQHLIWGLDSGAVKQFPSRIQVPAAAFDFVLGQAPITKNPDAMISWSHNGGGSWSNPVVRSLNIQGETRGRVTINRIGLSTPAGVRYRFRVSDPAYTSFAGARMDAQGTR